MTVECEIDEVRRRVTMRVAGGTTGLTVADVVVALIEKHPQLAGWDWIQDVAEASGETDNADVDRVRQAFASAETPGRTVFVSRDPSMAQWSRVMDHLLAGRRHYVVETEQAAHRLLDRLDSDAA